MEEKEKEEKRKKRLHPIKAIGEFCKSNALELGLTAAGATIVAGTLGIMKSNAKRETDSLVAVYAAEAERIAALKERQANLYDRMTQKLGFDTYTGIDCIINIEEEK